MKTINRDACQLLNRRKERSESGYNLFCMRPNKIFGFEDYYKGLTTIKKN